MSGTLPPSLQAPSVRTSFPMEKSTESGKKKKKMGRSFRTFVAACESNSGRDIPDSTRPPSVKYTIIMYNASRRKTKTKVVPFWKMPVKVADIKEKLQNEYNIPKSFQVIHFRGKTLENEQTLAEIGLYSGDTLEVQCVCEFHFTCTIF